MKRELKISLRTLLIVLIFCLLINTGFCQPAVLSSLGVQTSQAIVVYPNLDAAKKIDVPEDIRDVVIPIGATIHMDGTCLSAILKIAVLFSLFHMPFEGMQTIANVV